MIKVAHLLKYYLSQSETFIWQYLHSFKQVYPVIITYAIKNLEQFPLANGKIYSISGRRGSPSWFLSNWYKRILNRPLGFAQRIIKREKIHVLHAHSGFYGSHFLPLSTTLNLPLVTTFYGLDISCRDTIKEYEDRYRLLFEIGSLFLVEGPQMKKRLLRLGCHEDKISIQHIALDLKNYHFRIRTWDGKRPVRFLFVGRFVEKKGLEYALEALSVIKERFPLTFTIIGDGELAATLKAKCQELALSQQIFWHGMQPHNLVITEIEKCDILIQPSITAKNGDSEGGAPTVLLEAQACGVPIISSIHSDIPYITVPGKSALLSAEKDISGLVENITFLLENSDCWAEIGQAGRNHVANYHNVDREIVKLTNKYLMLSQD